MNSISLIILGFGNRGEVYASYALKHPDRARVVGFAEPRAHLRNKYLNLYEDTVDSTLIFSDWRDFVKLNGRVASAVVIALPDLIHKEAAIEFTRLGYHMLLEKPMANLLDDCKQITMQCREMASQINAVCHCMRYLGPSLKIKKMIDSGIIGDVVHINHTEPVGYWHFAHSYVRGNWHKKSDSSFSLLAKCCHDIDILVFWMGKKCTKVSSFGSLQHFNLENKPKDATTDHCFKCSVESDCCYSAKKIYLRPSLKSTDWPSFVVLNSEIENLDEFKGKCLGDIEDLYVKKTECERRELLERCLSHEKTNYGRCVYKMDNDVCDNQVVNMQFDDNSTATLSMIAFSKDLCIRKSRIYGTKGQIDWDDAKFKNKIEHFDFLSGETNLIDCGDSIPNIEKTEPNPVISELKKSHLKLSNHGGADYFLIDSFVEALLKNDKSFVWTDVEDSFRSHLIVFAAEHSRRTNTIVDINEFCRQNDISI